MKKHYILYLPGLGDHYDIGRRFLLKCWQLYGVRTQLVPMHWRDGNRFEDKLTRLGKIIEEKHAQGYKVTLIGESAGGSMALHAYAAYGEKLFRVMTVCGKNTQPQDVSPHLYRKNQSFKTSMFLVDEAISSLTKAQRQAFVSVYPFKDGTVPIRETLIPDCQHVRLWSFGHLTSIAFALTLASGLIVRVAIRKER